MEKKKRNLKIEFDIKIIRRASKIKDKYKLKLIINIITLRIIFRIRNKVNGIGKEKET